MTWGNCYFALFYMLIRRKAHKIVFVNSGPIRFPVHLVVLNKLGNAIHYQFAKPEVGKAPLLFVGYFEGISRSKQQQTLKDYDTTVLFTINCNWLTNSFILLSWLLLYIPFIMWMVVYIHIWVLIWLVDGIKKRYVRR